MIVRLLVQTAYLHCKLQISAPWCATHSRLIPDTTAILRTMKGVRSATYHSVVVRAISRKSRVAGRRRALYRNGHDLPLPHWATFCGTNCVRRRRGRCRQSGRSSFRDLWNLDSKDPSRFSNMSAVDGTYRTGREESTLSD